MWRPRQTFLQSKCLRRREAQLSEGVNEEIGSHRGEEAEGELLLLEK